VATVKIRGNILALPSGRRFLLHFKIMDICNNNNIQMNVVLNTVVLVICDCVRADTSNL